MDPYGNNADAQISKDISFATFAISDIDIMCAQSGEIPLKGRESFFYSQKKDSLPAIIITDSIVKNYAVIFNKTSCIDGRKRDGNVLFYYAYDSNTNPNASPNARYYHDFGFAASLSPDNYVVDGWTIELFDSSKPAHITNKLSSPTYDPTQTSLTWEISGKFKFTHPTDTSRNMVWAGSLIKTLTNTNDPNIFKSDKKHPINWKLAKVSYSGIVSGSIKGCTPFTYTIASSTPIVRDFNCAFVPANSSGVTEFHPFINGSADFNWKTNVPYTINYGPSNDCDNIGTIAISGARHWVTFD